MRELRDLYQEVILDHNRSPRNFRRMENPSRRAEGFNPLCGDRYTVYVLLEGDILRDIAFEGSGCAISKASASLMSTVLKGKPAPEAAALAVLFHRLVRGEADPAKEGDRLGRLLAFAGVSEFPARVKCASLPWHTLKAALEGGEGEAVSTE
ncbi:MAG: SUF system NifU family Fe-S cluster assembly protein [Bacteroidota bacterium]